jgi:hypothetical protein
VCPAKEQALFFETVVKMEVWPSGGGLQELLSNNPMLLGRQGLGSERLWKSPQ